MKLSYIEPSKNKLNFQVSYHEVVLCQNCEQFVMTIHRFKRRAEELDSMFEELNQQDFNNFNVTSVNKIRKRYKLDKVQKHDITTKLQSMTASEPEEPDDIRSLKDKDKRDMEVLESISDIITDEIILSQIPIENMIVDPDNDEEHFK